MEAQSSDDRGPAARRLYITMIIVPFAFLSLRLWPRAIILGPARSKKTRFWWDDWLAFATFVSGLLFGYCSSCLKPFIVVQNAIGIHHTNIGLGRHMAQVSSADISKGLLLLYAGYPLYDVAIALPRFSTLLFYARVFNAQGNKVLRITLWVTAALNTGWIVFAVISSIFQCTPIDEAWKPAIAHGHCTDTYSWWMGSAISSVIIDVIILLIPMPILWTLQVRPLRKSLLLGLFACGYW